MLIFLCCLKEIFEPTMRLILLLLIFIATASGNSSMKNYRNMKGSNMCTKLETYVEYVVTPRTKLVRKPFKYLCFSVPPTCTGYKTEIVKENVTVAVTNTRIIKDCCQGYEEKNKICVPKCVFGCGNGECVEPEICLCDAGWRGDNCLQQCERNRYGRGCTEICSCEHGATCDGKNGSCYCTPGYSGTFCEYPCREGTFGSNCNQECECLNGALCDNVDGYCECQPGYNGEYCAEKCEPGTHGHDCDQTCACISDSTENCSHVDGKCVCKPGYKGTYCQFECENMTFGRDCANHCNCEHAMYCDPEDGECFCDRGWMGPTCSQKCPPDFFGENCLHKCLRCQFETCNHVTGLCECPPGSYGNACEKECPTGFWGSNCTEHCTCSDNGICSIMTGECTCKPGWMGENCTEPCIEGWFGVNCSLECNCSNSNACHPITGDCSEFFSAYLSRLAGPQASTAAKIIISFTVLGFIAVFILIVYRRDDINWSSLRNCCRIPAFENNGTSRENIVGVAFPNPLYDRNERREQNERNATRRASFINIVSTIRQNFGSGRSADTSVSSSFETVGANSDLTLKRSSKVSNLSSIVSYGKLAESIQSSTQASEENICEETIKRSSGQSNASNLSRSSSKKSKSSRKTTSGDSVAEDIVVPEDLKDFNTPEIIIDNIYDYPPNVIAKVNVKME